MGLTSSSINYIASQFNVSGKLLSADSFGHGHINDTLLAVYKSSENEEKYLLRKINPSVFPDPALVISNSILITEHIRKKLIEQGISDVDRRVLTFSKSKSGNDYFKDGDGYYWCLIKFIEGSYSVNTVENEEQAYEAAKTFAEFQNNLLDLNKDNCHTIIKDFHNLKSRFDSFEETIINDPLQRASKISDLIYEVRSYKFLVDRYLSLQNNDIPLRIVHNDTKINNVLLDQTTNGGLCVVDLDTVMQGTVLNDFGDMVRTFTPTRDENDIEIDEVQVRLDIFKGLVNGYLEVLKNSLTEDERINLVLGAMIIVYEQTIRFLHDYLNGDVYYKVKYNLQNLDRAKNQFSLLKDIEKKYQEMQHIVEEYSR